MTFSVWVKTDDINQLSDQTRAELAYQRQFLEDAAVTESLSSRLVRSQVDSEIGELEQRLEDLKEVGVAGRVLQ